MPDAKSRIRVEKRLVASLEDCADASGGEAPPKLWYGSPRPSYLRALLQPGKIREMTGMTQMPHDRTNLFYSKLFQGEVMPESQRLCVLDGDRPGFSAIMGVAASARPRASVSAVAESVPEPDPEELELSVGGDGGVHADEDWVRELNAALGLDDAGDDASGGGGPDGAEPTGDPGSGARDHGGGLGLAKPPEPLGPELLPAELAAVPPTPAPLPAVFAGGGSGSSARAVSTPRPNEDSHPFADGKFQLTWRPPPHSPFGGWIAVCKYHKKNRTTACSRSLTCTTASPEEKHRCLRVLYAWCLAAPNHDRKFWHSQEPPVVDIPMEVVEDRARGLPPLPEPLLDDDELDGIAAGLAAAAAAKAAPAAAKAKPKGKAKPKLAKAAPAPGPRPKGKAKAKAKAGAPAGAAESSSSSDSTSASSSSASSSDS